MNGIPLKEGDVVLVDGNIRYGGVIVYNPISCAFCFEYENIDESRSFQVVGVNHKNHHQNKIGKLLVVSMEINKNYI